MGNLQTTTGNQLSTLEDKISAVNELLRPASDDAIASAVIKLSGAGLPFTTGIDPANAARVYQFALRGVSIAAIKRTVQKIVQGEVPTVREFLPAPPALAALCKAEAREIWMDRERLIATKEALEFKRPGGTKTPEAKARVRAMAADFVASVKQAKEQNFALYQRSEDELNRMFMNKVFPPSEPQTEKWDDLKWHQQQEEMDNGKENSGDENSAVPDASGEPDGRGDDRQGVEGVFGFEDGGE